MSSKHRIGYIALFSTILILFTLGFYRNQWQVTGRKWFYDWKDNSDIMVVGRLVESRQNGILSDGALLGWGDITWPITDEMFQHQFDAYLDNGTFETYFPYNSTPGLQGTIFGLLDQWTNFQPSLNLKLFRGITSVLSAIACLLIVIWFYREFGSIPALAATGFILLSEWLTLYAGSIYWQFWSFYVPMIGVGIYFLRKKREVDINYKLLVLIVITTTIIKCMFSGFEFITTSLAMMAVPVFYYSLSRGWKLRTFFTTGSVILLGAFTGVLISLTVLSLQIAAATGDPQQGLNHIFFALGKRSVGDPSQFSGIEAESLKANVWSVLWTYISQGRAINLSNWIRIPESAWLHSQLEIPYYKLFILFAVFSILFFIFASSRKKSNLFHKTLTLFYTTWFSAIPALSWLILFKAHSYIHTQLNYIVWQMPFTLFGFAFCGMVVTYLLSLRKSLPALSPAEARRQPTTERDPALTRSKG